MKTTLEDRIHRYTVYFSPTKYIPIHPNEYFKLCETVAGQKYITKLEKEYDLPIIPLGGSI